MTGNGVVGVSIGVALIVRLPALTPIALQSHVLHVRGLALNVVARVALAVGIVVHDVILTKRSHLSRRGATSVVGHIGGDV